ncbi:hypothetical protein D3C78_1099030 [compost metagenome]
MLHAHKDQTRFFLSGDDFNRVGDHFSCTFEKHFRVNGLTQGVSTDDGDVIRREALQPFGKQRQAGQSTFYCLFTEHIVAVQSIGEVDPLF